MFFYLQFFLFVFIFELHWYIFYIIKSYIHIYSNRWIVSYQLCVYGSVMCVYQGSDCTLGWWPKFVCCTKVHTNFLKIKHWNLLVWPRASQTKQYTKLLTWQAEKESWQLSKFSKNNSLCKSMRDLWMWLLYFHAIRDSFQTDLAFEKHCWIWS